MEIFGQATYTINGTPYKISRRVCHEDMVRIYDAHSHFITEIPYGKDWYEIAEIALKQIKRAA